jgi:hypothetical protein
MENYHRNASLKGRFVECYKWNFIKTNYTYSSINMGSKVHVKILKRTKEVWDTLKNRFQVKNVMNVNFLTTKFYTLKIKKEEDIEKQITKFCNLLNQLTIVGTTISDGVVACALLGLMPN